MIQKLFKKFKKSCWGELNSGQTWAFGLEFDENPKLVNQRAQGDEVELYGIKSSLGRPNPIDTSSHKHDFVVISMYEFAIYH